MTDAAQEPAGSSGAVNRVALTAGRTVGRYQILGVLGQGGFGITYRARDLQLGRDVALKEYLPMALAIRQADATVLPRATEVADDFAWGRERFVAEGRTLANLHEAPAVVRVFDFLEANGTAYIVMELLRGETLESRVKRTGPLPPAELDALLWPLLDGLQRVHEAGFLHRDITPANILVTPQGKPVLIDFGASRAAVAGRTTTMTAVFTPGYAASEQFSSAGQGPWTDIYGLAATLHYAVTGRTPPSAFDRLTEDRYDPLTRLQPSGFALSLLSGIDAGLRLRTTDRPQTVAAWRTLLGGPTTAHDITVRITRLPSAVAAVRTPRPRSRWLAISAAVALLLAGGYYALEFRQSATVAPALEVVASPPDVKGGIQQAKADRQKAEAEESQRQSAEAARRRAEQDAKRAQEVRQKAEAQRKAEDAGKLEEEQAKARAVPSAPVAAPVPAPSPLNGVYRGDLTETTTASWVAPSRVLQATLDLTGAAISGRIVYPHCGPSAAVLTVSSAGDISGSVTIPDAMACSAAKGSVTGRVTAQGMQLEVRGVKTVARGNLSRSGERPSIATVVSARNAVDGVYAGSLSVSWKSGGGGITASPLTADLRISDGRLTGRLIHPACGDSQISLPVDAPGAINGTLRLSEGWPCSLNDATLSGRVSAGALILDIRGFSISARGSLARRAD